MNRSCLLCVLAILLLREPAAVYAGKPKKIADPATRTTLPTDHPYQKQLRQYLATLTEKDFTHGVTDKIGDVPVADPEYQFRSHLMNLMSQPLVGTKRGAPAVNAPASLFVLSALESADGVKVPPVWPEALIAFVQWKYPGNVYYHNRALKLRAFATCCVHLMMMDDQLENHPDRGGSRADWFGAQLVLMALPYPGFKDVLPAEVRRAYETGLRRMGQRILDWDPEGEEPNLEIVAAVGLWHVSQAISDALFAQDARIYARRLFTVPRHAHPAGFFYDQRGIDMGYQGMSNFFATWAALASDWPFAKEAVERSYRLRAHLILPEPNGSLLGPSHFNSRTSSDAAGDQWEWGIARDSAAALVTNEAVYLTKLPKADELSGAPIRRASAFRQQLGENPLGKKGYLKNEEIGSNPWRWRLWQSFNFPATVNPGSEFYPAGAYAKRLKLEQENSPWLKSPFLREENFVRDFASAFTVTKQPSYAAIVHTGPVGYPALEDGTFKFAGPLGFGGGQLSAFWTPSTGAVILGRRGGNSWDKTFDLVPEWRLWPLHAVSGCKPDGKVFTSARIRQPDVTQDPQSTLVRVQGVLPAEQLGQGKVLEGRLTFSRAFKIEQGQLSVTTELASTGQDVVAELYETVPVFLSTQPKGPATTIEFQTQGQWKPATEEYQAQVTAVKLSRSTGAVELRFDAPQRVKLAPTEWTDTYLSRVRCRNLLIDLLDGSDMPMVLKGTRKLSWRIAAAGK